MQSGHITTVNLPRFGIICSRCICLRSSYLKYWVTQSSVESTTWQEGGQETVNKRGAGEAVGVAVLTISHRWQRRDTE